MKAVVRTILVIMMMGIAAMQINGQQKVVVLGNSIVHNIDWSAYGDENAMVVAGSVVDFTSKQMSWILDWAVYPHSPGICVIIGGQEDFFLEIPPETVAANFISIGESLEQHDIEPVLTGVIYVAGQDGINQSISRHNAILKRLAEAHKYKYVDLNERLGANEEVQPFGMAGRYLDEQGSAVVANAVMALVEKQPLPEPPEQPVTSGAVKTVLADMDLSRERIHRILAASPKEVRVVMLGNSITEMAGDWNSRLGMHGVRNSGQGGYATGQMLWMLDEVVLDASPGKCLAMGGVNDITIGVPVHVIFKNIVDIIEALKSHQVEPVVQSTLYQRHNPHSYPMITELNGKLRSYCEEEGITYLDLNHQLSDELGLKVNYTTDGTHLTEEGYKVWCKILEEYFQ